MAAALWIFRLEHAAHTTGWKFAKQRESACGLDAHRVTTLTLSCPRFDVGAISLSFSRLPALKNGEIHICSAPLLAITFAQTWGVAEPPMNKPGSSSGPCPLFRITLWSTLGDVKPCT